MGKNENTIGIAHGKSCVKIIESGFTENTYGKTKGYIVINGNIGGVNLHRGGTSSILIVLYIMINHRIKWDIFHIYVNKKHRVYGILGI